MPVISPEHHTVAPKQETQISPENMELILLPDEELAKLELDRKIMTAENDPNIPPGDMALLRVQRRLLDMSESDAGKAGRDYGESTGQFITHPQGTVGNSRLPVLWRPLRRDLVMSDSAASARWQILGIDDPVAKYGNMTGLIESDWRAAAAAEVRVNEARARADLLARYASFLPPPK